MAAGIAGGRFRAGYFFSASTQPLRRRVSARRRWPSRRGFGACFNHFKTMPRRRSRHSKANAFNTTPVTRVETVPLAREAALTAAMELAGYAPWTRRPSGAIVTVKFILRA